MLGGDACNVWWRVVSSATLGTNTSLIGNVLALTSITLQTNAALQGRALAQTGLVALDANVITGAACLTSSGEDDVEGEDDGVGASGDETSSQTSGEGDPSTTVGGLPNSGGAPIRNQNSIWSLVILACVFAAIGLRSRRMQAKS